MLFKKNKMEWKHFSIIILKQLAFLFYFCYKCKRKKKKYREEEKL